MNLSDVLDRVPPAREVWCSAEGGRFTAAKVAGWLRSSRDAAQNLRGKRVAVFAQRDLDFATLLLLLDGLAEKLTLIPSSLDSVTAMMIVVESRCEVAVGIGDWRPPPGIDTVNLNCSPIDGFQYEDPGEIETVKAERRPTLTRWLLPTSGTTGRPKLVSHTLSSLARSVKAGVGRGDEFTWGSLYSLRSFAGIQVFLQSWFSGSKFVFLPEATLTNRLRVLSLHGCNALSATPTMWRMVLMSGAAQELNLKRITLGGEICDQSILDALRATFPEARVVHIYASTEAGVGFAVRDGKEGFPVDLLDHPGDGVRIRVDGNRLLIKPTRSDQEYVNLAERLRDEDGFIDTGDLVERKGQRFVFRGRSSGVINVGGLKVHPQEIEATLLGHPDVSFAKVSARKNPITGAVVEAETVLSAASTLPVGEAARALTVFCRKHLEPHKVPAIISIVDSISLSSNGKIKR